MASALCPSPWSLALVSVAAVLIAALVAGGGASTADPVERVVTLNTREVKCHPHRKSDHVDRPAVGTFVLVSANGQPCMMATMGVQIRVEFLTSDDKDMTSFINVPANAIVHGSCSNPQWMTLTWKSVNGSSRNLTMRASVNDPFQEDDEVETSFVDQVSLRMEIDESIFHGALPAGEVLKASADGQEIFKTPFNNSFKCKDVTVDLKSDSLVGPITVSFTDVQFQAHTNMSTYSEGVYCNTSNGVDYVAIGIGAFLGATIVAALSSYVFCQWWRKRDH